MTRFSGLTLLFLIASASLSSAGPCSAQVAPFHVAGGQIVDSTGKPFIARGINIFDSQMGSATAITSDLPGINMIRLAVQGFANAGALTGFVNQMTAAHIIVEIEDHSPPFGSNNVVSGQALTNEIAWYASLATAFKGNPYVWFGTANEPDNVGYEAAVSNQQTAIYNAIRGAGNTNPIMLEEIAGCYVSKNGDGLPPSAYLPMTNVIWDTHVYGWESNFSTNAATITAALKAQVNAIQALKSADGVIPVIVGEYGISSTGFGAADANGTQLVSAVTGSGYGSIAWAWSAGTDSLVDSNNALNGYGIQIKAYFAANPLPPPVLCTPQSPNNTTVMAASTASVCDAAGNTWTLTPGAQVAVNGAPDTATSSVTELAYVSGTVWQENKAGSWYGKASPTAAWLPVGGTTTSPIPGTVPTHATVAAELAAIQALLTKATADLAGLSP